LDVAAELTIPLILDEAIDIGEKRLLEDGLRELLKLPQSSFQHDWHELVVQTALPKHMQILLNKASRGARLTM
jgi:hypothetical protein